MRVLIVAESKSSTPDTRSGRASSARVDSTAEPQTPGPPGLTGLACQASGGGFPHEVHGHRRFNEDVLGPLLHCSMGDVLPDDGDAWLDYRSLNRHYSAALAERCREGDHVLVCDFRLALVPACLRELRPSVRVGYYPHAPFPPPAILRALPWCEELLLGILGADLIGLHSQASVANFEASLEDVLRLESCPFGFIVQERFVRVEVSPPLVDISECERRVASPNARRNVGAIAEMARTKPVVLIVVSTARKRESRGVMQRVLAREPALAKLAHFVEVTAHVGEGLLASNHASSDEIACLFGIATVALFAAFSPVVGCAANEYVASRADDSGVLIVSEVSEGSHDFREALRMNPYDVDSVIRALREALSMGDHEQRVRMRALRARVARCDTVPWTQRAAANLLGRPESSDRKEQEQLRKQLVGLGSEPLDIFLGYDGALVPFAPLPELAFPDSDTYELLKRLARVARARVHLVSGRSRRELDDWFGELPIALHAEHGYWSRRLPGEAWIAAEVGHREWKSIIAEILLELAERTPGARVEQKSASVAFHYRAADPDLAFRRLDELRGRMARLNTAQDFEVVPGPDVLEVRRRGMNAGRVVEAALSDRRRSRVVAAAADPANEDLFVAAPPAAVTIHVGRGPTRAAYQLAAPGELHAALQALIH